MLTLIIRIIIKVRHHLPTSLHVTKSCRPTPHVSRNIGAGTGQGKLLDDHELALTIINCALHDVITS